VEGISLTFCLSYPTPGGGSSGTCVHALTTTGGHYAIDSSEFLEGTAAGFDVYYAAASHSAYFNYQEYNNGATLFHVAAPFPFTHDISMVPASGIVLEGTVTNRVDGSPIAGA